MKCLATFGEVLKMRIRTEHISEAAATYQLVAAAFAQAEEADLVEKLRTDPAFIPALSMVGELEGELIAHILYTQLWIVNGAQKYPVLALAPMSVRPDKQKQGYGGQLIQASLTKAKELGYEVVIVLGHPTYYPKFGFKPASKWEIKAPFPVPD